MRPRRRIDLTVINPHLAAEWHPTKNLPVDPREIRLESKQKAWWQCSVNSLHEWQARIDHRLNGVGCPLCSGLYVTPETSLSALYPHVAEEWHPALNGDLTPDQVRPKSDKIVVWQCRTVSTHVWSARVKERARGNGCPMCAHKIATPTTSLQTLFPSIAVQWHPTRNGKLMPGDVVPGSERQIWWRCSVDPAHEWQATPRNRTVNKSGCPICAGQKAMPSTSLQAMNPSLAAEWHPKLNGTLTTLQVLPRSNKKVWWQCPREASHVWRAVIKSRANGNGCPFCAGLKATLTTSLLALHPLLAAEWDLVRNAPLTAHEVLPGSGFVVWWQCHVDEEHVWQARVQHRVNGSGCPYCREVLGSSREDMFAAVLDEEGIAYERHKVVGHLHPDFYLPAQNLIVEVQGCYWHGCVQCGFDTEANRQKRKQDRRRHSYFANRGHTVCEIWEHDIIMGAARIRSILGDMLGNWEEGAEAMVAHLRGSLHPDIQQSNARRRSSTA